MPSPVHLLLLSCVQSAGARVVPIFFDMTEQEVRVEDISFVCNMLLVMCARGALNGRHCPDHSLVRHLGAHKN